MPPPRENNRGPEITVSGVIERILWLDEESHFTIAELSPEAGDKVTIASSSNNLSFNLFGSEIV